LLVLAVPVRAQDLGPILDKFAGNYAALEEGIVELAASGHPRSHEILTALAEGRLLLGADKKSLAIHQFDRSYVDAMTGDALAAAPAGAKPVKLNNRIRRALDAAFGSLNLFADDPAVRLAAAEAQTKARNPAQRALVEKALESETDPGVRSELELALAVIVLAGEASEAAQLTAVARIAEEGTQEARGLLASLGDRSPAVKAAIDSAIASIDSHLALLQTAQDVAYGISLGSVLLLAAIGLAITFGVMGVINMAHGEMVMLGAYTTFVVQEQIRDNAPWLFEWSLAIALPLAFLVAGAVGVLLERTVIRFLYGRPLETLLATFGVSLILQQAVRALFGANNREVGNPDWMSGSIDLAGLTLTYNRLWIVLFALLVFFALQAVLRRTHFGLEMRAVTQNRRMASAMGIRTRWVDALTFGLGSGVAGIAGVALSQIGNVSPNLGQDYIIDSFMVVVFGGVGNLWGTLVAAFSLGVANKLLEPFAGAVLGKILVLVGLVLFIQRKPRGLFPLKGRAAES
jgi:urea transport system permease protein